MLSKPGWCPGKGQNLYVTIYVISFSNSLLLVLLVIPTPQNRAWVFFPMFFILHYSIVLLLVCFLSPHWPLSTNTFCVFWNTIWISFDSVLFLQLRFSHCILSAPSSSSFLLSVFAISCVYEVVVRITNVVYEAMCLWRSLE